MVLMRWADVRKNADEYAQLSVEYSNTDALIFVGGLYLIFAAAVVVGLFVGTEYSDGTIRNKLSAGHARRDIYLSKLIVCAAADVVIYVVYILVVLGLGQILLGGTDISCERDSCFRGGRYYRHAGNDCFAFTVLYVNSK